MKRRSKHPPGSPKDVLVRLKKTERDVQQMLIDVQSCNDNNPHFKDKPMDIGRYLVRLKTTREIIANVEAEIAAGAQKLSNGILDRLCEPW